MIENFEKYWFIVLVLAFKINVLGFFFYTESLETAYLMEFAAEDKIAKLESKQHLYEGMLNGVLILDGAAVLFLIYYGIRKSMK
ncbi:hypothetical protein [Chryseobacterium camelliae]|uniref:hypothetical protein n=1 Tax=Chryseobacterium camelliae TaxID=1265445 RepID=UPI00286752B9|nr:hypothetical protein [Chryseobacterium camelliae]MDR6517197.1 hypothetical protein [Chryseobacterium camelliae]